MTSLSPLSLVEHNERPLSPTATSHCALTSTASSERGLGLDTDFVLDQFHDEHVHDYENLVVVTPPSTAPPVPPRRRGSIGTGRRQTQTTPTPVLPTRDTHTFVGTMANRKRTTQDEHSIDVNSHDSECGSPRAARKSSTPEKKTLDEKFNSPSSSPVLFSERYWESGFNNNKTPASEVDSNKSDSFEEEEEEEQQQRNGNPNTTDEEEEMLMIGSGGNRHASIQGGRGGDIPRARKPFEVSSKKEIEKPYTKPSSPITFTFEPVSIAPVAGPSSPIVFRPVLEDIELELDQEEIENPIKEEVTMMESPSQTRMFSPIIPSHRSSNTREFPIFKALTRGQLVGGMVEQPVPTRIEVEPPTPTDTPLPPMLESQPMARVSGVRKGAQELDAHLPRASAAPVRPPSGTSEMDYIDYRFDCKRAIPSQLNTDHQF